MPVLEKQWSDWSPWSECTKNRTRPDSTCSTGQPSDACSLDVVTEECDTTDDYGEWLQWGAWTACKASCGDGLTMRTRTCRDQNKGCLGESTQAKDCELRECPEMLT